MSREIGATIKKDPNSVEPQGIDWTLFLAEIGAAVDIASSAWSVTGPDALLTLSNPIVLSGNLRTQVFLTAGTLGAIYTVTNRITTNSVPVVTEDASFHVLVEQK